MKKFIAATLALVVCCFVFSGYASETDMHFPVSMTITAIYGEPYVSSRDLFSEATGVDIPPTVLMFIENDETFMISWARSDGYYEYWTLDVDDVDSDLGFINTVLAFTIMCDTYYSRVVYANANGDILQYYPEAVDEDVEDVEDYTYTTYDEFETAIFLSVLNAYIDEK